EYTSLPPCGRIYGPRGGEKVAVQADDDDDEALEPHADVHEQREDEQQHDVVAHLAEPAQLDHAGVDRDQHRVRGAVGTRLPVLHHELFVEVAAVPRVEDFVHVCVGDDHAGGEHDFRHVVDVAHRDQVFEVKC